MNSVLEQLDIDIARLTHTCESIETTLKKLDRNKKADAAEILRLIKDKTDCGKLLRKLQRERDLEKAKQARGAGDATKLVEEQERNRLYTDLRSHYIKEEDN